MTESRSSFNKLKRSSIAGNRNAADILQADIRFEIDDALLGPESNVEGASMSTESNKRQLIYLLPFNQAGHMAPILAKIEAHVDFRVAIELTSLEDAYLRIVEKEREKTTGTSFMDD